MLIWFGRHGFWGHVLVHLPGMRDIQMQRFVMGVDLAAILIAGVGLAWIVRQASVLLIRWRPTHGALLATAASLLIVVGVLAPAWTGRASYDRRDAVLIRAAAGRRRHRRTGPRQADRDHQGSRQRPRLRRPPEQLGPRVHDRRGTRLRLPVRPRRRCDRLHVPHALVVVERRRGGVRRDEPRPVPDVRRALSPLARGPAARGSRAPDRVERPPPAVRGGEHRLLPGRRRVGSDHREPNRHRAAVARLADNRSGVEGDLPDRRVRGFGRSARRRSPVRTRPPARPGRSSPRTRRSTTGSSTRPSSRTARPSCC